MKLLSREQFSERVIAVLITIVTALFMLGAFLWQNFGTSEVVTPTSFKDCVADSRSKLQESYPEVCITVDGERFVNPDQKVSPAE